MDTDGPRFDILGIPLQVVSPVAGHSNYSTTRKYAHATADSMERMLLCVVGMVGQQTVSTVAEYLYAANLRED